MQPKRFMALAAMALLVISAMGFVSAHAFAQITSAPASHGLAGSLRTIPEQGKPASGTPTAQPEATEPAVTAVETDTVQSQSGDQAGPNDSGGPADQAPDGQSPQLSGSIVVTQTADNRQNETAESAALASRAKITADTAKAAALAANPGTTVVKAILDNENGALVYSVELSNGSDVKMDAGSGKTMGLVATDAGGPERGGSDARGAQAGSQSQQP